MSTENT